MKGRRRARRVALQALYELDVSGHALEAVMPLRLADLYHSAAVGALPPRAWPVVQAIIDAWPDGDIDADEAASHGERLGFARQLVEDAAEFVRHWAPHARYCDTLVREVWAHRATLDGAIARLAPEWPVAQMAPVDRNVLRIALWEMASGAVPSRVAINEAVELARTFSGEGARRMVNGALGAYANGEVRLTMAPLAAEAAPQEGGPR